MALSIREFEAMLTEADGRLKRLRTLYDQWFCGIERFEPHQHRTQFDMLMTRMGNALPRNTALRFRYQQLQQRYKTYSTYWSRVARQIEEGTYHRDVLRARRRREKRQELEAARAPKGPVELDANLDVDAALHEAQAAVRKREQAAAHAHATAARPASGGDLSDAHIQEVYKRFVAARAKNAERTDNVRVESIAKTLRGMMPKLRAKHGDRQIDFDVIVKDGRVALRPKAR